jgi:Thaumatin family
MGRRRKSGRRISPLVVAGTLVIAAGVAFLVSGQFGAGAAQPGAMTVAARPLGSAGASGTSSVSETTTAAPSLTPNAVPSSTPASATTAPRTRPSTTSEAQADADERTVTFVNDTSQTVWPAAQADPSQPLAETGWVVAPGQSVTITMPDHWNGRLWGRTGCSFDASGTGHCVTGDCAGRFQCGSAGSVPPETLAEFDLDAWDGMDFYDVNLDGFNLPMYINHTGGTTPDKVSSDGCIPLGCTHDLLATCPSVLQDKVDGTEVGCLTACDVFNTDQYCCRGAWGSRATCIPSQWPVDYAAIFKAAEPTGYSYVYDDQTSVYTCSGRCDYKITFGVSP